MAPLSERVRKAAVLLGSLPNKQTAQLLARLAPRQTAVVKAALASLRKVAGAEREAVVQEFTAANVLGRAQRRPERDIPFRFLYNLDRDRLLDLLGEEHPQTVALVLSRLPPRQAAAVFAELLPDRQFSVVCRLATMREPSTEVIGDVERGLRRRLSGVAGRPARKRNLAGVVRMLHRMEPVIERTLLGNLAAADPRLANEIRRAMFGADVAVRQR
jgi:flagellar motor switch protein FliG